MKAPEGIASRAAERALSPERERSSGTAADDVFVFPASFAQQRLWFLHELEPASSAHNLPILLRATGPLDVAALSRALSEIVRRHESLRTTFALVGGEPMQLIAPEPSFELDLEDLSELAEQAGDEEAKRRAIRETRRPFDLARGSLFRACLWRLSEEEHVLLLNTHHAVADGWSFQVLLTELEALYEAFREGRPSPLPPLPIQYADYAAWQRTWLVGEVLEKKLSHWKKRLAGAPPALDLPTDHPRPRVLRAEGATETRSLPSELAESVRRFAQREGATSFMTMLTAFAALLHRYTGRVDIVIGSPIAGRSRPELESLIGLFINTLALRVDLSGDPTVRELLGRVREAALDAYAHQDLPFEKLVEDLKPVRDQSRSPLFQVLFLHQKAFIQPFAAGGVRFSPMRVDRGGSGEDLSLFLIEREGEGLTAGLEYKTTLFDAGSMERMLGHYQTLLEGMLAEPQARLSRLPLLRREERERILVSWNQTSAEFPAGKTLHRLFEEQAERTPQNVAALFGHERLTYRELSDRANRLARFLRRMGIGPEALVGVCLERSLDLVVGLLGVLKAGAAYVPLDPSYPEERLSFMLEDARATVVLTQKRITQRRAFGAARVVCLDADQEQIWQESPASLDERAAPGNLAYVIYTSGSTGKPKGVAIAHKSAGAFLHWAAGAFRDSELSGVLAATSICFDLSIFELFTPLLSGGTVILAENALALPGLPTAGEVTLVNTVPSVMAELTRTGEVPSSVKTVNLAGEALPRALVERIYAQPGIERVFNLYGPTEATTYSTVSRVEKGQSSPPAIGRPIANTRVYLVDSNFQPVPIGVPGELYIGGAGLARGYLGRPELTAERFLPDPFGAEGDRLYRTGDVARYRADGEIEFLGRGDHQVKIRGFRIELGEIEEALAAHPSAKEVVVVAREDAPGEKRLVAYLVFEKGADPGAGELRDFLKRTLPDAMVPAAFVLLPALPRAPNGKVDQSALPLPEPTGPAPKAGFVPARDPLESQVARIWEEALGVAPVGTRDNFFDLGGHSFLAMIVFSEIEKAFGRRLPLATLFEAPTVEEIVAILLQEKGISGWSSLVPISSGGTRPPFYCVHAVGGNVLTYADLARRLGPDQPVYGLQAVGLDGSRPPHATVEEMARHYAAEIRRLQPDGPYALGGTSAGGLIAYEVARQLEAAGETVALLALFDTYGPHSVSRRPGVSSARLKVYQIADRFLLHFENFLAAERMGKASYVAEKSRRLKNRFRQRWKRFRRVPLPPVLRLMENAISMALASYIPRPYGGRVTLFRANRGPKGYEIDPTLGWGRLAREVEVHHVSGYHGALVYEPRVGPLAKQLAACLESAFSTGKGRRDHPVPRADEDSPRTLPA